MEKQTSFKSTHLLWLVFVVILPLLGACQKENEMEEEGAVPLSEIPENPTFAGLPLIGTKWQLIGFVNANTGRIKKAEKPLENTYTVLFNEDSTFTGHTYSNIMVGEAEIDIAKQYLRIIKIGGTEINEFYDGRMFFECMRDVVNFTLGPRGLSLYYSRDNYLLLKPLIE